MSAGSARNRGALPRILLAATASVFLASCTSGGVPPLELAIASVAESPGEQPADNELSSGQTIVPDSVATAPADDAPNSDETAKIAQADDQPAAETDSGNAAVAEASEQPAPVENKTIDKVETAEDGNVQAQTVAAADSTESKKRGFLSSLWSPKKPRAEVAGTTKPAAGTIALASAAPAPAKERKTKIVRPALTGGDALPGVSRNSSELFEIKRKSGLDDDSDVDINEDTGSYRVASAAGLARLAPNGLLTQREGVDVACIKPALVRVLKKVERHYGRRVVVTSGYRSPSYNRKARGARNSLHMYCAAVDIQIDGVTKWELARYLRSMPGRGGVGTYCHTKSVHVDVGPERDWNWRCRRRKKRRS